MESTWKADRDPDRELKWEEDRKSEGKPEWKEHWESEGESEKESVTYRKIGKVKDEVDTKADETSSIKDQEVIGTVEPKTVMQQRILSLDHKHLQNTSPFEGQSSAQEIDTRATKLDKFFYDFIQAMSYDSREIDFSENEMDVYTLALQFARGDAMEAIPW